MDQLISPCHHPTALTSLDFRVKFGFWRTECAAAVCLCWCFVCDISQSSERIGGPLPPQLDMWHGEPVRCAVYTGCTVYSGHGTGVYTWAVLCHHQVGYPRSHSVPIPLMPELLRDSQSWSSVNMSRGIQYLVSMSSEVVTWDTCSCDTGPGYNMMWGGWGWWGVEGWSLVSTGHRPNTWSQGVQ